MERLRKGTQREIHNDVRDVQKNIALIRAPEGIRKKDREEEQDKAMELDEDKIVYEDARVMEKRLETGIMEHETGMLANWNVFCATSAAIMRRGGFTVE